ncbi:MAG: GMC oxidoreductase, partial [Giesbergeria sp.]
FHPDSHTHITQNRFPPSYGFMRMYMGPLVDGARPWRRGAQVLWAFVARPVRSTRSFFARHWYRRMSVLTVMQHADNAMAFGYGRTLLRGGRWGLRSQVPGGARPPSYLPQANAAARHFAQASGGQAMNVLFESLGNLSVTAHVLGGAVIASRPEQGVVDAGHQVFGCPGLYVVDASAIPANVGVNPSLTVTALAERFAMRFPHR